MCKLPTDFKSHDVFGLIEKRDSILTCKVTWAIEWLTLETFLSVENLNKIENDIGIFYEIKAYKFSLKIGSSECKWEWRKIIRTKHNSLKFLSSITIMSFSPFKKLQTYSDIYFLITYARFAEEALLDVGPIFNSVLFQHI